MAKLVQRPLTTPDPMRTEDDAGEYLGFRPGVLPVKRLRGDDVPKFYRLGRSIRYRQSDLDRWLERHAVESRTAAN